MVADGGGGDPGGEECAAAEEILAAFIIVGVFGLEAGAGGEDRKVTTEARRWG